MLNDLQVKAAAPRDREYMLSDGEGLYLRLRASSKAWICRYQQDGKPAKLMVITGAADKAPSRVQAIVYADAYVPEDGASVWSLTTSTYRERFIADVAADGLTCAPPAHLDKRCRAHPMATFLQAIELTGDWRKVGRKGYVAAFGWEGSPFIELYERLESDPEWATYRLDCAHDIPRLAPEALTKILLAYT